MRQVKGLYRFRMSFEWELILHVVGSVDINPEIVPVNIETLPCTDNVLFKQSSRLLIDFILLRRVRGMASK